MGDFGKRLRQERVLFGMTQQELADETAIAREKIGRLENDERKPTTDELLAFARVFQTTVDALLTNEAQVRYRVNTQTAGAQEAIAWLDRCVENSLFVRQLPDLYARR